MRVIVQRVNRASVHVAGDLVGEIGKGVLLLVGFGQGDTAEALEPMAQKVARLRIFSNAEGRFDRDLLDVEGEVLAVPQFTLYADTSKGRRPEFFQALAPDAAKPLFEAFVAQLTSVGVKRVASGVFGAYMQVDLENDGPVTITLER